MKIDRLSIQRVEWFMLIAMAAIVLVAYVDLPPRGLTARPVPLDAAPGTSGAAPAPIASLEAREVDTHPRRERQRNAPESQKLRMTDASSVTR